uniref:Uncharacterized protein n=1 Tax=Latimeria chalumnae TaxID=7897 RepID=H3AMS8_LATCH
QKLEGSQVILRSGGPGSGKGTQCEKLVSKYELTHLSTGDLLRSELAFDTERSKLIQDIMERGELVPLDIVLGLLKEAMVASLYGTQGFLIDGYPREVKLGQEFEKKIAEPSLVLFMDCSAETMTKRLIKRSQANDCIGDNTETIRKRVETYYNSIEPVIAYYEKKNILYKV